MLILIVEDDEAIASVLAALVEDLAHEPVRAKNGHHALELARIRWPSLVLTDLMMPGLDGAGTIALLRAEAAATGRPPVPVILITAAMPERAHAAGANVVMHKPFDVDELQNVIERTLHDKS